MFDFIMFTPLILVLLVVAVMMNVLLAFSIDDKPQRLTVREIFIICVIAPFFEELFYRDCLPRHIPQIICNIMFSLAHINNHSDVSRNKTKAKCGIVIMAMLLSMVCNNVTKEYGIWYSVLFHSAFNIVQLFTGRKFRMIRLRAEDKRQRMNISEPIKKCVRRHTFEGSFDDNKLENLQAKTRYKYVKATLLPFSCKIRTVDDCNYTRVKSLTVSGNQFSRKFDSRVRRISSCKQTLSW